MKAMMPFNFRRSRVTRDQERGFTLIEVMIVIAIMAIMAAIAAPNYQEFMAQRRLNGTARLIMSDLMNARMQAVSQNNKVIVSLTSNHQYQIVRDRNNNMTVDTGETGPSKDIHPDYSEVTFAPASTGYSPVFNTDGTAINGKLILTNSGGSNLYIKIATGGRVKINNNP